MGGGLDIWLVIIVLRGHMGAAITRQKCPQAPAAVCLRRLLET